MSGSNRNVAVVRCNDELGKPIVRVRIQDRIGLPHSCPALPTYAVLDADDFDRIQAGGYSLRWSFNASDAAATWAYVRFNQPGTTKKRMVSHLVVMPPQGTHVKHRDGNPLNLRGSNLYIAGGGRTKGDVRHVDDWMQDPFGPTPTNQPRRGAAR